MVSTYKGDFEEALENFTLSYQKAQKENEHSGAEGAPVGESKDIDEKQNNTSPVGS